MDEEIVTQIKNALNAAMMAPHVLHQGEDDWSLRHPLRCRPDMLGCPVHKGLTASAARIWELEEGFYYITTKDSDELPNQAFLVLGAVKVALLADTETEPEDELAVLARLASSLQKEVSS